MSRHSPKEIERIKRIAAMTIDDALAQAVQWNKVVYRQVIQELANEIWQRSHRP